MSANLRQIYSQASAIVWVLGVHGNTLRARRVPLARQIQFTFDNIGLASDYALVEMVNPPVCHLIYCNK